MPRASTVFRTSAVPIATGTGRRPQTLAAILRGRVPIVSRASMIRCKLVRQPAFQDDFLPLVPWLTLASGLAPPLSQNQGSHGGDIRAKPRKGRPPRARCHRDMPGELANARQPQSREPHRSNFEPPHRVYGESIQYDTLRTFRHRPPALIRHETEGDPCSPDRAATPADVPLDQLPRGLALRRSHDAGRLRGRSRTLRRDLGYPARRVPGDKHLKICRSLRNNGGAAGA